MFKDSNLPKNDTTNSVEDLSQSSQSKEWNGYHYKEQKTRSSDASNNLMEFTWKITKAWFSHVRGKFFEKPQNRKNPTKLEIIYGIKRKRREARQNWKEERQKKAIEKKVTEN